MYLFIDCETTGLPRRWNAPIHDVDDWPRAVQIAWLLYDEGSQLLESVSCLVRPVGFTIPREAQRIHGITTERAINDGLPLQTILTELDAASGRSSIIVAHNIAFDYPVISAEYLRLGLRSPLGGKDLVCTMKASTEFCRLPGRRGYKWPTLAELHYALFRTPYVEAHDAGADVATCAKCFFELKKRQLIAIGGRTA